MYVHYHWRVILIILQAAVTGRHWHCLWHCPWRVSGLVEVHKQPASWQREEPALALHLMRLSAIKKVAPTLLVAAVVILALQHVSTQYNGPSFLLCPAIHIFICLFLLDSHLVLGVPSTGSEKALGVRRRVSATLRRQMIRSACASVCRCVCDTVLMQIRRLR